MKVLFICKGNMYRSQMAAAIYNKLTNTTNAFSVGTYPGAPEEPEGQLLEDLPAQGLLSSHFFDIMDKNGMDVRKNKTTKLQPGMLEEYDCVISMAEEPYIPDFLKANKKVVWWNVKNPTSVTKEVAENTFAQLSELIQGLIYNSNITK